MTPDVAAGAVPRDTYLLGNYAPYPIVFTSGAGARLWDSDGKEYLDCLGGIGCIAAGHCHPDVTAAICTQAGKLVQTSLLFWNEPVVALAERLHGITGWGRAFFANSGAEANECALKLARKWGGYGRHKVVCAYGGFSGRTLATLAATGQPGKWEGFEPLPQGFVHAPFGDLEAFAAAVDDETCAIFVEPIQGENGIWPASREFLVGLRDLCDSRDLALVFDEVQTGMGKTGHWWAWQHYGVEPDVFTSAKALGNGVPIGACIANDRVGKAFGPGAHGSTFGGQPLTAAAALATIDVLDAGGYVAAAVPKGERLRVLLEAVPHVVGTRGVGLMLAAVLETPRAREVVQAALRHGLVVQDPAPDTVRFLPPLVIGDDELAVAAQRFAAAVEEVYSQ